MQLAELISPRRIAGNLDAPSKQRALEFLGKRISQGESVSAQALHPLFIDWQQPH